MKNNEKKKFHFITEYSGIGGGESSLLNLVLSLNKKGFRVKVTTMTSGKLNERLEANNIEEYCVNYKKLIKKFRFLKLIFNLKDIIESDEIVILNSKSSLYLIPFLKITSKKEIYYIEHSNWTIYNFFEKSLIRYFCEKILVVSEGVKRNLFMQFNNIDRKVELFPLGISINNKKIKHKKISSNGKIVAMIGRFQKIKGHDFFIDIANNLVNQLKVNNITFVIIGGKPFGTSEENEYEAEVLNKINLYALGDKVKLLGEREDIESLLENYIDILVIPSQNESFGMVVLEAAKYGVPIITSTNCEGPKEILETLEVSELVLDREATMFAKKILELCGNDNDYIKKSNKIIKNIKYYDIENACLKLENITSKK